MMKNPLFKETNKISIEIKDITDILVYQLKNISNAFYFACLIYRKNIQIYKYSYETKSFKNIGKIDVISSYFRSMKYFYNPLDKKEYFFIINDIDEIEIYLIKNENNFELIQKFNYINDEDNNNNNNNNILNIDDIDNIDNDSDSVGGGDPFTTFNFLGIFYDENDKNVYVIISYLIMQNAGADSSLDFYKSKSNNIFTFKDGKLNLIKTFKFDIDFNMNILIYEKNDFNKKYLIDAHENNNLILTEIKSNYDNYEIENLFHDDNNKNELSNFIRSQRYYDSCFIYGKNNFDYLYIFEANKLMIINFTEKSVDNIIDFNQNYLRNMNNWNNNYIIFFQYGGKIDIYDTNNNKIIKEYKKKDCRDFISHSFPGKDETLGIFKYYDKIECYFA